MCYSAQVWAEYKRYVREWGADVDIHQFMKLYWDRDLRGTRTPRAMDLSFARAEGGGPEAEIAARIAEQDRAQAQAWEQDLFKQRKRLADAQRSLAAKTTKAAQESARIAAAKVEWLLGKLADLRRTTPEPRDSRIFPGWHAPVMVREAGRRVLRPMRYQCRPAGKPANYDKRFPGCYNARRDNLDGFWREQFGAWHAVVAIEAFYEHVRNERGENVILEFRPQPAQPMFIACLWSHWKEGEEELMSFAAITDEPPAEVAAAGHDRCVIPLKPEHVDEWLAGGDVARMQALLDDRARPYYEHQRIAA